MLTLRELEERVLANGRVEGHDLDVLRQVLYADGKIDRTEADFLVELHKRVQHRAAPAGAIAVRSAHRAFFEAFRETSAPSELCSSVPHGSSGAKPDLAQDESKRHGGGRNHHQREEDVNVSQISGLRLHLLRDPG